MQNNTLKFQKKMEILDRFESPKYNTLSLTTFILLKIQVIIIWFMSMGYVVTSKPYEAYKALYGENEVFWTVFLVDTMLVALVGTAGFMWVHNSYTKDQFEDRKKWYIFITIAIFACPMVYRLSH